MNIRLMERVFMSDVSVAELGLSLLAVYRLFAAPGVDSDVMGTRAGRGCSKSFD